MARSLDAEGIPANVFGNTINDPQLADNTELIT